MDETGFVFYSWIGAMLLVVAAVSSEYGTTPAGTVAAISIASLYIGKIITYLEVNQRIEGGSAD
ncbi:hypothetical protein [Halomicrococcus sp. NG-SE-24]|uniref:hypothetical protein n=1 Tax=Halomicrococcus sp. NG-SE-24 TaxID=3436928 RepID=UPI003D96B135